MWKRERVENDFHVKRKKMKCKPNFKNHQSKKIMDKKTFNLF